MGFTEKDLGLQGLGGISSRFGEVRDGCPHKGMDVRSGGVPTPFKAGIHGQVTFRGGDYCTIAIAPLDGSAIHIQYLHCSDIFVEVGQKVFPWTTLGKTGDCAPPGTNISGIHLHLQVQVPGAGLPCWETRNGTRRNFIDPQTYDNHDFLSGTWFFQHSYTANGARFVDSSTVRTGGYQIGMPVLVEKRREVFLPNSGCQVVIIFSWNAGRVTGHNGKNIEFLVPPGSASVPSSCGLNLSPNANFGSGDMDLQNMNQLRFMGAVMTRIGKFSPSETVEQAFGAELPAMNNIKENMLTDAGPNPSEIDIESSFSPEIPSDDDWLSGVAPNEHF